jgi:hypothetical protein
MNTFGFVWGRWVDSGAFNKFFFFWSLNLIQVACCLKVEINVTHFFLKSVSHGILYLIFWYNCFSYELFINSTF